ncbi:MAG TPA: helix-hairpin-helix domain-containing protein [Candidatus Thermoplasmatota archaeon]|nr:helix-hairpin-helix domain-containing protein [Candidatus Thermoplasmatota archaeon]
MDLERIKGLGPKFAAALRDQGVRGLEELRDVDVARVSAATGISEAVLAEWQREATLLLSRSVDAAAGAIESASAIASRMMDESERTLADVTHAADDATRELRVVLQDRARGALVRVGATRVLDDLPVYVAKLQEKEEEILRRVQHDVVVLREKADTALVRVEGVVHENVPVFRKALERGAEEVRVAVDEAREGGPATLLRRWLKKA